MAVISKHALDRALDMGVSGEEIRQCLFHPERVISSHKYPGTENYQAGRIVLAVRDDTVVTVSWSSHDLWREDMARGEYAGRTFRSFG